MPGGLIDLLTPDLYEPSLADIDLVSLRKLGITCLLLDLDNTILPWRGYDVPASSCDWISHAREMGMKICIASNTRNPSRLRKVAEGLGVPCLEKAAKPRRRGLRAAMEMIGGTPGETAMIGDQVFTDVLGGNRLGLFTILVNPMHSHEFAGTKLTRMIERPLIRMLRKRGLLGTKGRERASEVQD
jgi:HAD superfamily phosphatase (TIGR01668 family)